MNLTAIILFGLTLLMPVIDDNVVVEEATKTTFTRTMGQDPEMTLLGVAPRTKWFFKVYGVGLYADVAPLKILLGDGEVTEPRLSAAVTASPGHRALVLKFVRDIEKQKISDAFKEGIAKTVRLDDKRIASDAEKLLNAFRDIKNGDVAILHFNGSHITLIGNDEELVSMDNRVLTRALLAIYIGLDPIDKEIKRKLLHFKP